jgi:hypothetical protein
MRKPRWTADLGHVAGAKPMPPDKLDKPQDLPGFPPGFLTIRVDADEYEEALRDPRVHRTNREATEFLERLEREGRSL